MKFTLDKSREIWEDRYQHNGETLEGNFRRVASGLADTKEQEERFFNVMNKGYFFPAGRTMCNVGIGKQNTLNNCFNLNSIPDSMDGIFEWVKIGALTQKAGGGTGYDFSKLRPAGTPTSNEGVASGPVSFIQVFDAATNTILQGGRRGANMGAISVYHPDIVKFIKCKSNKETLNLYQRFNLSVMVDDAFMNAVADDKEIDLHWPVYDSCCRIETNPNNWKYSKKIRAKELWDIIIEHAYNSGEPGVLFYDNLNNANNLKYCETIVGTNPCAEFVSGLIFDDRLGKKSVTEDKDVTHYKGACNLGSLCLPNFLVLHTNEDGKDFYVLDKKALKATIAVAVEMLDQIIDKTYYPHPDYEGYQKNLRTIGLGFTGLADTMAMLGLTYGSPDSVVFADYITNFIAAHAYLTSTLLAQTKGAFPFFNADEFAQSDFLFEHTYNRFKTGWPCARIFCTRSSDPRERAALLEVMSEEDVNELGELWDDVLRNIYIHGIRNGRLLSVAPTGTMSLTFGNNCSGGLEPIFMLSVMRDTKMGGQDEENVNQIFLIDPAWATYLKEKDRGAEFKHMRDECFVTAGDPSAPGGIVSVDQHLEVLAAIAKNIDMSCSKTINIPTDYSFEATKDVFTKAWKKNIKGCTIFRENEYRPGIMHKPDEKPNEEPSETDSKAPQSDLKRGEVQCVNNDVIGRERHLKTGCGTLHFQAFFDPQTGALFEAYASKGSTGGCNSFMTGLSRMISLSARGGVPIDKIIDQLLSTPPCVSYCTAIKSGDETSRGLCCPMAMGHALKSMSDEIMAVVQEQQHSKCKDESKPDNKLVCPDCGEPITYEMGCQVCKSCGWTKCG